MSLPQRFKPAGIQVSTCRQHADKCSERHGDADLDAGNIHRLQHRPPADSSTDLLSATAVTSPQPWKQGARLAAASAQKARHRMRERWLPSLSEVSVAAVCALGNTFQNRSVSSPARARARAVSTPPTAHGSAVSTSRAPQRAPIRTEHSPAPRCAICHWPARLSCAC